MATRGTYTFVRKDDDDDIRNRMHFYCHWDNYPDFAAERLYNAIEQMTVADTSDTSHQILQDRRGGLAFAFVRGNLDAEPTSDPRDHADTEYRYFITESPNKAPEIQMYKRIEGNWITHESEPLTRWVNRIRVMADVSAFKRVISVYEPSMKAHRLVSVGNAIVVLGRLLRAANRFDKSNPNHASYHDRADIWRSEIVKEVDLDQVNEILGIE